MIHSILRDKATRLYLILGGFFVANALIAEMIGVKLFQLETALGLSIADFTLLGQEHLSFVLSVGVLPWPVVFIMTDVVNDYYGVRGVRFLTVLTAVLIAFAFIVMYFAIGMPPAGFWIGMNCTHGVPDMQAAFSGIFGQGMNIIVGSLTAFVIGQLVDAFIFRRIKRITGDKRIWLRATGSTIISQLMDSVVVTYVAFYFLRNDFSFAQCTAMVLVAYTYKLTVALLATPLVYAAHALVEQYLGPQKAGEMRAAALASENPTVHSATPQAVIR
ncbi:MAG: queuosine precursor transporter [Flavobacteriales bacterium]|nr:queuosine precursor transporter [Flavobacteriales bacterium]